MNAAANTVALVLCLPGRSREEALQQLALHLRRAATAHHQDAARGQSDVRFAALGEQADALADAVEKSA